MSWLFISVDIGDGKSNGLLEVVNWVEGGGERGEAHSEARLSFFGYSDKLKNDFTVLFSNQFVLKWTGIIEVAQKTNRDLNILRYKLRKSFFENLYPSYFVLRKILIISKSHQIDVGL